MTKIISQNAWYSNRPDLVEIPVYGIKIHYRSYLIPVKQSNVHQKLTFDCFTGSFATKSNAKLPANLVENLSSQILAGIQNLFNQLI